MPEIVFIVPVQDTDLLHRTLSMLSFQKEGGFRACVVDLSGSDTVRSVAEEFEHKLSLTVVGKEATGQPLWKICLDAVPEAEWVCFLRPDVGLTNLSVKRMRRCIADHPAYDAFHWNLVEPSGKMGLKIRPDKLFLSVFEDGAETPLSSFVFRAQTLRDAFATDPESAGMDLAVILSGAKKTGIRTVRWERVGYSSPVPPTDPSLIEKEVRARLTFLRWSERFFGDDYPMGTGDRLDLIAKELARLYPSYTADELKENMNTFAVVNDPIRKMRASAALKAALKDRQESLK